MSTVLTSVGVHPGRPDWVSALSGCLPGTEGACELGLQLSLLAADPSGQWPDKPPGRCEALL